MRKIIVGILVLIVLICTGCADMQDAERNVGDINSKYISMQLVEEGDAYFIYRDVNTDVLYLAVKGGYSSLLTPILNADGTPRLYSNFE